MSNLARFRSFIQDMTRLAERHGADEPRMLDEGEKLLRDLVSHDDWLPEEFAAARDASRRRAQRAARMGDFCCELLERVAPLVPAVKPQSAFFEEIS